ncbi:MAG TPA: hypothetical protein PK926_12090 [Spirochaetota bacterium]|nr:hypothetical protein [Spirochaetota bacterium]HPI88252.1 hypothetical protein [Spirochaetota bacterium]HPR47204.1 hypothetical protein [Spirochaetota bacterium]
MDDNLIKANLNLYAVLQNFEELCGLDGEARDIIKTWDLSIQFSVRKGAKACLVFKNGACEHRRGPISSPSISLYFISSAHCNKMFEGKATPVILKGFTRLKYLIRDFPKLTGRLEFYLKPTDALLKDSAYLSVNTRMTLNTAAFAVRELALNDDNSKLNAGQIGFGTVLIKVAPDGPSVSIEFKKDDITVSKIEPERPECSLSINGIRTANAFFNGKIDTYSAVARGDIAIRGIAPMLDSMAMILNRIPLYLS